MTRSLPPIRRIVVGNGADGKSRFVEDRLLSGIALREREGFRTTNVWVTTETPVKVDAPDRIPSYSGLHPPKNGTVLRFVDVPPDPKDRKTLEAEQNAVRARMFQDADRHSVDRALHPGMHVTDTVDYAVCIYGEIYALMEEGETLMRAGDVLIQRGTIHAWANRSDDICRMLFVLIDGQT